MFISNFKLTECEHVSFQNVQLIVLYVTMRQNVMNVLQGTFCLRMENVNVSVTLLQLTELIDISTLVCLFEW